MLCKSNEHAKVPRNAQAVQFLGSVGTAPAMTMIFEDTAGKLTELSTCSKLNHLIWSCCEELRAVLVEAHNHQACPKGVIFRPMYLVEYSVKPSDSWTHGWVIS